VRPTTSPVPQLSVPERTRLERSEGRFVPRSDGEDAGNEDLEDGRVALSCQLEQRRLGKRGYHHVQMHHHSLDVDMAASSCGRSPFSRRSLVRLRSHLPIE
jgi:hypothetical protein